MAGKEARRVERKVVVQEGVAGWRVAQEREVCEGWAEEVIGVRAGRG